MKQNMISQKDFTNGQKQFTGKSKKELPKQKANNNRHVSVLYGMQFLTRVPVVKRSRKTEKDCFGNIDKQQIFSLVHGFVNKLLQDEEYLQTVIEQIKFDQNQLQTKIMSTDKSINSKKILKENVKQVKNLKDMVSINILDVDEKESFGDFGMMSKPFGNKTNLPNNNKAKDNTRKPKISIMLQGDDFDFGHHNNINSQQFSSALFSQQTLPPGLSSIEICEQQLTIKMIELIYEQPQPFLINLSVCLMLKYLHCSRTKLTKQNVCWILSVGTIIAYKIYYDEPVEGLVESFTYILKLSKEDIITLERHFLGQIDHQAVISSQQYHSTLYQIIKHGSQ